MKVLQISHKPPFPVIDGGSLAIANLIKQLVNLGADITLLSINTPKHKFTCDAETPDFFKNVKHKSFFTNTTPNVVDAFSNFVTHDSYHISRFFSVSLDLYLEQLLKEETYDIVILESIFTIPYISTVRRFSKAKIVLRAHNVEHNIWAGIIENHHNFFIKGYLNYAIQLLQDFESNSAKAVDAILTLTESDKAFFKNLIDNKPVYCSPFCIDLNEVEEFLKDNKKEIPFDLFHIGAMDWQPNQQGLKWFVNDIFPELVEKDASLKLHLAGKSIGQFSYKKSTQVINHGEVSSSKHFMNDHKVLVVPLHAGSGQRVKIVEALSMGKPVISTKIGASGLNLIPDVDYLEANTELEFVDAVHALKNNVDLQNRLSVNGKKAVMLHFNLDNEIKNLAQYFHDLINSKSIHLTMS
ncbi:MAG: glycosyltransferase family 4 protein [Luteibaculaceae bacterium]